MKYAAPFLDLFRQLTSDERQSLKTSIESRGVDQPIVVYTSAVHGKSIIDGINRAEIADELGVPCPVSDRGEMSDEAAKELAGELNLSRRHLEAVDWMKMMRERRERVDRVVAKTAAGKSQRTIAAEEGVSQPQVVRDLKSARDTGVSPEPESVTGADGKVYPYRPRSATMPKEDLAKSIRMFFVDRLDAMFESGMVADIIRDIEPNLESSGYTRFDLHQAFREGLFPEEFLEGDNTHVGMVPRVGRTAEGGHAWGYAGGGRGYGSFEDRMKAFIETVSVKPA